ncbi:hypothetical protein NP233_g2880 [Leucocoprinus birnbaumii]|uniref:BTB domain-containing protein n=1 Tax=Leucocoprinus birnbaumii TaxID=56174 RepID=A0AAD5YWY0_9AGAR|nr:hypothetical protein NP233_g2880 [Leucocoprinus birnbaumii]
MDVDKGDTITGAPFVGQSTKATIHRRDKDYYFDDGSAIFLVGTRLFKIHKTLLTRGSPFFQMMFALPSGAIDQDGQSDDRPIRCYDSLRDFRALCWALYAGPSEILAQANPKTMDISKMISITVLGQKYDFKILMDWALDMLEGFLAKAKGNFIDKVQDWDRVGKIFVISKQSGRSTLAHRIEEDWLHHILDREPYALTNALIMAEGSPEFRTFHAKAYYNHLKASGVFKSKPSEKDVRFIHEIAAPETNYLQSLNDTQKLRILQGFWSLSLLKIELAKVPGPKLPDNPACATHARDCAQVWREWWEDLFDEAEYHDKPLEDPWNIIEAASKKASKPMKDPEPPCDDMIRAGVKKMAEDFFSGLADRFMIP